MGKGGSVIEISYRGKLRRCIKGRSMYMCEKSRKRRRRKTSKSARTMKGDEWNRW